VVYLSCDHRDDGVLAKGFLEGVRRVAQILEGSIIRACRLHLGHEHSIGFFEDTLHAAVVLRKLVQSPGLRARQARSDRGSKVCGEE
jgi:hypothetical protein